MSTSIEDYEDQLINPPEQQRAALTAIKQFLENSGDGCLSLIDRDGRTVAVPAALQRLLNQAAPLLAHGHALALASFGAVLTPDEAAEALTEPVQTVLRFLEAGAIPATATPNGWEIALADLVAYKARRDAERGAALAELTRYSEEIERATAVE